jgi:hypothetical protein
MGAAALSDTQAHFLENGVETNVGMVLYNLTTGLSGPVTAATEHTLTATGVTWNTGDAYRIVLISTEERSTIEHYLNIAAADIYAALGAAGACDCTLAAWAADYLAKLNIIEAGAYHVCPCANPTFSDEARARYLEWAAGQLDKIMDGTIDVCDGHTGKNFPAFTWAEQSLTEFNAARIVVNDQMRNP